MEALISMKPGASICPLDHSQYFSVSTKFVRSIVHLNYVLSQKSQNYAKLQVYCMNKADRYYE